MSLVEIELHLSPAQIRKARNGMPIQISSADLHKTTHKLMVHPHHAKKIHAAKRKMKGVRLHLSQEEMEGSGFFDKLKEAASFVKNKIIDTDTYQKFAKPIVRQLVDTGVNYIPVGGPIKDYIKKGVDVVGQKTNAYGIKHKAHHVGEPSLQKQLEKFVAESIIMPSPGNGAFTAFPAPATGDGVHSNHIHNHYYYPMQHDHIRKMSKKSGIHGSSFRLA